MADLATCKDCDHKFYLQGKDLANVVSGAGCPNCGGHQVYRTQMVPGHSEMEAINMVDPDFHDDTGGNPLQEGMLGGWQNRQKRDEFTGKTAAAIEALPYEQAGIHFGPSAELARHGVLINGQRFDNPQDIAQRYSPMNPSWDRAPVILEHEDPNVLAGAKEIVESGNAGRMHPYVYNAHKDLVQPHPNGLSSDVVLGLGALDTYLNDNRVRGLGQPQDLPWSGEPVSIGARSPEELDVAKRVLTEGSSNPAREYMMRQKQARTAAFPEIRDRWRPGKEGRGFVFPDGSVSHWYVDSALNGWPTHIDAAKMMGIDPTAGKHFEIQPDGGISVYAEGPERDQLMTHILAANPRFRDQAAGWTFAKLAFEPFMYEQTDIEPGLTMEDYRHNKPGLFLEKQNPSTICPYCRKNVDLGLGWNHHLQAYHPDVFYQTTGTLSSNNRMKDTFDQEIYMPWTVTATEKQSWLGPFGDAVDAVTSPLGDAANTVGNAAGDVGSFIGNNAVPLGLGLAGGALMATGVGALGPGEALEGAAAASAAGEGAAAAGDAAAAGGAAAGDAAATGESAAGDAASQAAKGGWKSKLPWAGGGAGGGSAVSNLMKGALGKAKGYGSNYLKMKGMEALLGGGQQSTGPAFQFDQSRIGEPGTIPVGQITAKTADYESPSSNPDIPGLNDDFHYVDPHEFMSGDERPVPTNPNLGTGVGSDSVHPAIQKFYEHLPTLLHYYTSDESGADDPRVLGVHHALEAAHPGYLAQANGGVTIHHHRHHHGALPQQGVGSNCPHCGGVLDANGHCPQCGYTPPQQQPAQGQPPVGNTGFQPVSKIANEQEPWASAADSWMDTFMDPRNSRIVDPYSRKTIHELARNHFVNGRVNKQSIGNWPESYRQAWINMKGFGGADDIHKAVAQGGPTVVDFGGANDYRHPDPWMDNEPGTTTFPAQWLSKTAEINQGPQTDEQKAAVAELLEQEGRGKEIPNMLENGHLYAKELAKVQHKLNPPPPNVADQDRTMPPQPPQDPSQAGMPMPGMQSPQQPLSSIIKRFAVDNVSPRCPKCKSHTTGVLNEDGECRCHACGNVWKAPLVTDKVGRVAVDNVAKRCPKCKSHTTGVLNEDGETRCHACGNIWKEPLTVDKVGAEHHEERQNILNAPAADQSGQRDLRQEQDSSGYWQDDTGNHLVSGEEYEMHSSKYPIPDIIRIESVKPNEITFVIQSQYGLNPRDSVSREEAQMEQLSFRPYKGDARDQPEQNTNDDASHAEGPGQVTDLSVPPRSEVSKVADVVPGPPPGHGGRPDPVRPHDIKVEDLALEYELQGIDPETALDMAQRKIYQTHGQPPGHGEGFSVEGFPKQWQYTKSPIELNPLEEGPVHNNPVLSSEKESSTHCSKCESTDIYDEWRSPEQRHFSCYRCGYEWNIYEDDQVTASVLPEETRTWLNEDAGPIPNIGLQKDLTGMSRNIHDLAMQKSAGKKYTPGEQREFINEKGKARNKDRLDLSGTHYEARTKYRTKNDNGYADLVNDDHLALGI